MDSTLVYRTSNTVQHWSTNILAVTSKKTVGLRKDIMDMTSHTHTDFYRSKDFRVAFVVDRTMNRNVNDFMVG